MEFFELKHPLVAHKLSLLRDKNTPPQLFRTLISEITMFLVIEATKNLPLSQKKVETPLERIEGHEIAERKPVFAPILRAGLGMLSGALQVIPVAKIAHIGIYRNEETLKPQLYYFKIPPEAQERRFFILDPMLATGGSLSFAITKLKEHGITKISCLTVIAAPEGIDLLKKNHPDITVYSAALDRKLSQSGFILPGLGDAGDRLFGTG